MEKDPASLPLEGKVPTEWGNEVESCDIISVGIGKRLLFTSSVTLRATCPQDRHFPSRGSLLATGI